MINSRTTLERASAVEPVSSSGWFRIYEPNPAATRRIFCLPQAGAGASVFRQWGRALPPDVEVVPVQLPGRESRIREQRFDSLAMLVPAFARALRPHLNAPYYFYGHSLGALIVFETIRFLARHGLPGPCGAFIASRRAPFLPAPHARVHAAPDEEFIRWLRQAGGTDELLIENRKWLDFILPILRDDIRITESYEFQPGQSIHTPFHVFGGRDDPVVPERCLHGWLQATKGPGELRVFPGGHHFHMHEGRDPLLKHLQVLLSTEPTRPPRPRRAASQARYAPIDAEVLRITPHSAAARPSY